MAQSNHTEKASLVQRYVAAVNTGDLESFDELFAPDYVNHTYRGDQIGPEGMRQFVTRFGRCWRTSR
jgi:ketosteroid isomerase-like protein